MASSLDDLYPSHLRQLWGTFQTAAQQHLSTADVWTSLRASADRIARNELGLSKFANLSLPQVQQRASEILGGVSAADVSRMRGVAGSWLRAKTALTTAERSDPINESHIFKAPWAQSVGNRGSSERYRMRIKYTYVTDSNPEVETTRWGTYDLVGMPTTSGDLLAQAIMSIEQTDGGTGSPPLGENAQVSDILDYELEAI